MNDVGLNDKEEDSFDESHSSFEDSEEYESEDDDDNSDIGDISGSNSDSNENPEANRKLKKQMNKKDKSKFFYDVDPLKELTNDIDQDELERISADEQTENRDDILKERNKKKS